MTAEPTGLAPILSFAPESSAKIDAQATQVTEGGACSAPNLLTPEKRLISFLLDRSVCYNMLAIFLDTLTRGSYDTARKNFPNAFTRVLGLTL